MIRQASRTPVMLALFSDLRHALRALRRSTSLSLVIW
jgi:hypothetical protein